MDASVDTSRMTREIYPMPDDVAALLRERRLVEAYSGRPAYQQNDYIGWIGRAKRPETRQKRIDQMLQELESGGVYMRMKWRSGDRSQGAPSIDPD
jgi:uncharacterized protein YdeI (YjbR/CyaY-like superfamily)